MAFNPGIKAPTVSKTANRFHSPASSRRPIRDVRSARAEELPHMRPVFLLTMPVVVLPVGSAARPRHRRGSPGQMPVQRPVQELAAVVGVEVRHLVRHLLFPFPQLHQHGVSALVPNRAVLGPAAEKLGKREGIDVNALGGVVAMHGGVGLDRSEPRGREPLLRILHASRKQQPVNRRRTDLQNLLQSSGQRR